MLLWREAVCKEITGGDRDFIIAQINTGSHQGGEPAKEATMARLGALDANRAGTALLTLGGRTPLTAGSVACRIPALKTSLPGGSGNSVLGKGIMPGQLH